MSGAVYIGFILLIILIVFLGIIQQENFRTCSTTGAHFLKSDKPSYFYWDSLTGFAKPSEHKSTIIASVRAQQKVVNAVKEDMKRTAEYETAVEQQTHVNRSLAISDIPQCIDAFELK